VHLGEILVAGAGGVVTTLGDPRGAGLEYPIGVLVAVTAAGFDVTHGNLGSKSNQQL